LPQILVELDYRFEYQQEEVEELLSIFQNLGPEYDVQAVCEEPPRKGGNGGFPLLEAISIWISEDVPWGSMAAGAAGGAAGAVGNQVMDWVRHRFQRRSPRQQENPYGRIPIMRAIYGPRGEILDIVELEHPDAAPIIPQHLPEEPRTRDRSTLREWPPEWQSSKED
jgi:hypothetical protein